MWTSSSSSEPAAEPTCDPTLRPVTSDDDTPGASPSQVLAARPHFLQRIDQRMRGAAGGAADRARHIWVRRSGLPVLTPTAACPALGMAAAAGLRSAHGCRAVVDCCWFGRGRAGCRADRLAGPASADRRALRIRYWQTAGGGSAGSASCQGAGLAGVVGHCDRAGQAARALGHGWRQEYCNSVLSGHA